MRTYLAPAITLLLLCGIWLEQSLFHAPSGDAEPYHERLRDEATKMPYRIGDWIGLDVEVPPAAVALLKPNVLLNRRFKNPKTGRQVSMLLVQCGDARDLLGHYPPVCYVRNGWIENSATTKDWKLERFPINGMEYQFERSTFEKSTRIIIDNFMLLPNGITARTMEAINTAAQDYRRKFYGAAQIQFVFSDNTPPRERDEILYKFLKANRPMLDAIRSGTHQ